MDDLDAFILVQGRLGWWWADGPERDDKGRVIPLKRTHQQLVTYMRGIRRLAVDLDRAWVVREIKTIGPRLLRGVDFKATTPQVQQQGDDLFIELLRRYEVLRDVAAHQKLRQEFGFERWSSPDAVPVEIERRQKMLLEVTGDVVRT